MKGRHLGLFVSFRCLFIYIFVSCRTKGRHLIVSSAAFLLCFCVYLSFRMRHIGFCVFLLCFHSFHIFVVFHMLNLKGDTYVGLSAVFSLSFCILNIFVFLYESKILRSFSCFCVSFCTFDKHLTENPPFLDNLIRAKPTLTILSKVVTVVPSEVFTKSVLL